MDESLKKFNRLPQEFKDRLSGSDFLGVIERLEQQYRIKIALAFVKLVVGDLVPADLKVFLTQKQSLSEPTLSQISQVLLDLYHKAVKKPTESKIVNVPVSDDLARQPVRFQARASLSAESVDAFTKADEQEIKAFENKVTGSQIDYLKMAAEIIAQFGYNKKETDLVKRLSNVVVARLKDIRDRLETRENLKKSLTLGGLEFNDKQADDLLALTDKYLGKFQHYQITEPKRKLEFPTSKLIKPLVDLKDKIEAKKQSLGYQLDRLKRKIDKPTVSMPRPEVAPALNSAEIGKHPKIVTKDGLPTIEMEDDLMIKPKLVEFGQPNKAEAPSPLARPYAPSRLNKRATPPKLAAQSGKPTVDGIKFTKQLVGPVEELGRMTLIDFRRLGETSKIMTDYIRKKVALLEEESYTKRIEGIKAWHANEVSRFYRLLGQASMAQNKSVEGVIDERLKAGKPTLSWDEFKAVMELNKELRF